MEKPFSSASTSKITVSEQEKRWGKQYRSSYVFLSLGATEPQWVGHSRHALPFSSGMRGNQRPVSVLLVQWPLLPHTRLYSKSVPMWSQQQQQGWHLWGLSVPHCRAACLSLVWCCSRAASSPFCVRDIGRSGKKKESKPALAKGCWAQVHRISHLNLYCSWLDSHFVLWKCA